MKISPKLWWCTVRQLPWAQFYLLQRVFYFLLLYPYHVGNSCNNPNFIFWVLAVKSEKCDCWTLILSLSFGSSRDNVFLFVNAFRNVQINASLWFGKKIISPHFNSRAALIVCSQRRLQVASVKLRVLSTSETVLHVMSLSGNSSCYRGMQRTDRK